MSEWKSLNSVIKAVATPAFVLNEKALLNALDNANYIQEQSGASVLYALKPLTNTSVMQRMVDRGIDGFAASSLFETKLARDVIGNKGTVHFTSPGLRKDEIEEIGRLCEYISFNSLSQYQHHREFLPPSIKAGIRINPRISFVKDKRYDPCREDSKLGVPVSEILLQSLQLDGLSGFHIHTNCEACSFTPLLETVQALSKQLHPLLKNMEWMNLGGGYCFDENTDYTPLFEAISLLRSEYGLQVFMEPGSAFVGESGCIVTSVIDTFTYGGTCFAVLDTTVNHLPEVYEYQYRPAIAQAVEQGKHKALLVGGSCLAGDIFGEYSFNEPLKIGTRLAFLDCGAYTHVKAHMFNGINLPTQYMLLQDGTLELKKKYTFHDYLARCGSHT